jgi:hypothetical protein
MSLQKVQHRARYLFALLVITTLVFAVQGGMPAAARDAESPAAQVVLDHKVHLPVMLDNSPWSSPYGFESHSPLVTGTVMLTRAIDMNASWTRMGIQVSWRALQPVESDPSSLDFASLLASFNAELLSLNSAGITPVVTINSTPAWAGVDPSIPCSAIRADKYAAFAGFVSALVKFYSVPTYNVHNWELGNEPDVDPTLVPEGSGYGCWGDKDDLDYYGGRAYGEMLKVVGPAMRSQDSAVRIWIGGLLLDAPNSTNGKPENFLRGILSTGAAPHFDVVPYHWHPSYYGPGTDYDLFFNNWSGSWGGGTIGKARYLRQLMAEYGVSKPLTLNETGFGCITGSSGPCDPPGADFYKMQSEHLVRAMTRALSQQVTGFIWYTLSGPGWRNSALLEEDQSPRPSYVAYQVMSQQLDHANYQAAVNFGAGIEAYQFRKEADLVQVAWAVTDVPGLVAAVPQAKFINAYLLDGTLMPVPPLVSGYYQVPLSFSPVYIVRAP